jgi:hypothetical protein
MKNFRAEMQRLSQDSALKWFEKGTQQFHSGNFEGAVVTILWTVLEWGAKKLSTV